MQGVEAQISRIKRCIAAKPLTQKLESQNREGVVIANIINLWNSFGRPVSVKKSRLQTGAPHLPNKADFTGSATSW
ncbi:hypothetical protein [Paraburkholderia ginsengiterrae]|uniref:hypothetical protein n=1 Tax=Paraburkholderia ginsengiterrae TaxID=1462993 RepID=UPI000AC5CF23|nr:hypothetical protein [Paraburkholderia ginsengiterrae]